jgi:N-acetylneuraminic acid mutarotase
MTVLGAAVMAGAALTMGAGSASAAPPNATFDVGGLQSDGSRTIVIKTGGTTAGTVKWTANGDTLTATDSKADGWGISGYVTTNPYLIADTGGHAAPYTDTAHKDLTENKSYTFWACIGSNSEGLRCSDVYKVTS